MPKTGPCDPQILSEVQPNGQQEEERVPDMEAAFSVFPNNGILQPSETAQFRVTFAPPNVGDAFVSNLTKFEVVSSVQQSKDNRFRMIFYFVQNMYLCH